MRPTSDEYTGHSAGIRPAVQSSAPIAPKPVHHPVYIVMGAILLAVSAGIVLGLVVLTVYHWG